MRARCFWALGALALVGVAGGCGQNGDSPTAPDGQPDLAAVSTTAALAFQDVKAGWDHSCGLTTDARIVCWGRNEVGQLGDGTRDTHFTPVAVTGGRSFASVSTGTYHTCGITRDNRLFCWGWNSYGQLGISSRAWDNPIPTEVTGGRRYRAVEAGQFHTCAITTDNRAFCWGRNRKGQLGDGTLNNHTAPVAVARGLLFRQISAGFEHSCGVTTANRAYCWGENRWGKLGDSTTTQRTKPQAVAGGFLFLHVKAGFNHTCGLATSGKAYCWGDDLHGELGDGAARTEPRHWPIGVVGGRTFRQVDADILDNSCGVTTTYKAYCWGYNNANQLGDGFGKMRTSPYAVAGGLSFRWISAGGIHTCAVTPGNRAYCWGFNGYGALGDGTENDSATPVPVAGQ
jgi:alpha-tubulin suppressor-like RCC1 family protein